MPLSNLSQTKMVEQIASSDVGHNVATQPGPALGRAVAAVRRTTPTPGNAKRLWLRYHAAWKDDLTLANLACNAPGSCSQGIDGMTELLSCDDFFQVLSMRDCVTLEVPEPDSPHQPPRAFLMVPYATRSRESIERFREYFLGTVFDPSRLRYLSPGDARSFHAALDYGNVVYLADFVSQSNAAATMALLIAAHAYIVDELFQAPQCALLGKCLDYVQLGAYRNELGNQRIRQLATSFGLRKIGDACQERSLELPPSRPDSAATIGSSARQAAQLVFGLYLGDSAEPAPLVRQYRECLDRSILRCHTPD